MSLFDVDIDIPPYVDRAELGLRAIQYLPDKKAIKPHPSGYYINDEVAVDALTGSAAIDYQDAESRNITKVDLLTNTAYSLFKDKADYLAALTKEPDWRKLNDPHFVSLLPQIGNQFELLKKISPTSISELADVLAMIRPAKRKFVQDYATNKAFVREQLYKKPKEGMYFKKSHAISYAQMIVAVMNRMDSTRLIEF